MEVFPTKSDPCGCFVVGLSTGQVLFSEATNGINEGVLLVPEIGCSNEEEGVFIFFD